LGGQRGSDDSFHVTDFFCIYGYDSLQAPAASKNEVRAKFHKINNLLDHDDFLLWIKENNLILRPKTRNNYFITDKSENSREKRPALSEIASEYNKDANYK